METFSINYNERILLWFKDLESHLNPTWNAMCFVSVKSLEETKLNPSISSPFTPNNIPISLPVIGLGFLDDEPPKYSSTAPDSLTVRVNVIVGEFVKCVVSKDIEFAGFNTLTEYWELRAPLINDTINYQMYGIGYYSPQLLGGGIYSPRLNERHDVDIHIYGLDMATRYTGYCATSPLPESETISDYSSKLITIEPTWKSTRGNNEAIKGLYPQNIIVNERTLIHFDTANIYGDNFNKIIGFTATNCDSIDNIISPTYLQFGLKTAYVLFNLDHIGYLLICYSGDGGETWWLQDNKLTLNDIIVDVTATSRYSITNIIPKWATIGLNTQYKLKSYAINIIGDGWSKKVGLSLDGCNTVILNEYIQTDTNIIYFVLQNFQTYDVCYSNDYGQHWTLQITRHLNIVGYATELGPSNAKIKVLKLQNGILLRPFHPDILKYDAILPHVYNEIKIEYEMFEISSELQFYVNNKPRILEPGQYIPITAIHISPETILSFKTVSPNGIIKQEYIITLKRSAEWGQNIIKYVEPNNLLSEKNTILTFYPLIHGDNPLVRASFVPINDDCTNPKASIPIDYNSQSNVTLSWNYFGKIKYQICYTIDGGNIWYKQESTNAFITIDGNGLRTPWYILTGLWVLFFILIQIYCIHFKFESIK